MNIHEDQSLAVYVVNVFRFYRYIKVKYERKSTSMSRCFITKIGRILTSTLRLTDFAFKKIFKFQLPKSVLNNIVANFYYEMLVSVCLLCKSLVKNGCK